MLDSTHTPKRLSPTEAQDQVFQCWRQLERLAQRRFPGREALAQEALLYVLNHLQDRDWQRVRCWEGEGNFLTYVATLAGRLLTDFSRDKFGYIRKPKWLADKSDPLWHQAYRLVASDGYSRREAIEALVTVAGRERWRIEEVVATMVARCGSKARMREPLVSMETPPERPAPGAAADELLEPQEDEILEALRCCLSAQNLSTDGLTERVRELSQRLESEVQLSDEERLLLRMRYVDGVPMKTIVRLLHLEGDVYKRCNKLIAHLRQACERIGAVPA